MKIGYFITHFPCKNMNKEKYFVGGGPKAAYNLVKELLKEGHEIFVFTTSYNNRTFVETYNNLKIIRFKKNFKIGNSGLSFELMFKSIKYHNIDIVHIHNTTAPGVIAGIIYAKRKRKPVVVTHHGAERFVNFGSIDRRIGVFMYTYFLVDKVFSTADVIISPSEYYVNDSKYLRKYSQKVKVIPNGIDLKEFNIIASKEVCRKKLELPVEKDIILFLSALTPKKGPQVLLKAMNEIIKMYPDVILVLAGSGTMRKELENLASVLGIKDYVKFVGFVEEDLKSLYYNASDIFVLPSIIKTEVFPIVLLEASAAGLPLVTSNLSTFKCIVEDGYNGFFTKKGDEKDLASKILYLLENKNIKRKLANNAREKAKDFSWKKIAKETEKIYEELIVSG